MPRLDAIGVIVSDMGRAIEFYRLVGRSGRIEASEATERLGQLEESPFIRHNLQPLLQGAWQLRDNLRLVDALYVELATRLVARLITADQSLAHASEVAEVPEV
ncbi:MAG: hypothetical protein ACFCU2_03680 [Acidimicrobiia bacterium]